MNNYQLAQILALVDDPNVILGILDAIHPPKPAKQLPPPPAPKKTKFPDRQRRRWTQGERDQLRDMVFDGRSIEYMCRQMERTPEGIAAQLRKLGFAFDRTEVNYLKRQQRA